MERCVHKHLYNFLTSNKLLTSHQSGFIKGDSITNQLTYMYNEICKAMDTGKEIRAVFYDISKAFDRVWHRGLLLKLSSLDIKHQLLNFFKSYHNANNASFMQTLLPHGPKSQQGYLKVRFSDRWFFLSILTTPLTIL